MWKNIKKFFKWIADHTGISWVARKISLGWNSIKSWWSGQSHKNDLIELIKGKSNDWGIIKENGNKQLILHVKKENVQEIMDIKNINHKDLSKYYVRVRCDKGMFKIAYSELLIISDNVISFIVKSVEDGKTSSSELEGMKRMLGLNSKHIVGTITQISQKPEVANSASKVPVNDSKALSLEAANTVNNNSKPDKLLGNTSKERLMLSKIIIPTL